MGGFFDFYRGLERRANYTTRVSVEGGPVLWEWKPPAMRVLGLDPSPTSAVVRLCRTDSSGQVLEVLDERVIAAGRRSGKTFNTLRLNFGVEPDPEGACDQ